MKVSVIIPVYNRFTLLQKSIDSLLRQSLKPDEIIVVDDGSTLDIKEALLPYKNQIKLIQTKNLGVSSARNIGIKSAKNDWIALLDSDDEWREDKLQKQTSLHVSNPHLLFSHTGEKWIRDNKEIKYPKKLAKPQGWCFLDNTSTCKIAASSVMFHRSICDDIGYFDEKLKVCEDYDFWLRVSYSYEIGLIDEPLIIKKAGHTQLSKEIFAIDRYHIYSLQKFLNSKYKEDVKRVIEKKCKILIKGAIKHKNREILEEYTKIMESL